MLYASYVLFLSDWECLLILYYTVLSSSKKIMCPKNKHHIAASSAFSIPQTFCDDLCVFCKFNHSKETKQVSS
jgi:hypothetical protein